MSVYNGQQYLSQAIKSILDQEFGDFEFLAIDDASTDSSRQILEQMATEDSRVKVLENSSNLGLTRSLNRGLECAKGKFVARIDADDFGIPWAIGTASPILNRPPELRSFWAHEPG